MRPSEGARAATPAIGALRDHAEALFCDGRQRPFVSDRNTLQGRPGHCPLPGACFRLCGACPRSLCWLSRQPAARPPGSPWRAAPPAVAAPAAASPTAASPAASSAGGTRRTVATHCGVVSTTVEGTLWLADPPLGDHNPPTGWNENEQAGVFAVRDQKEALFTADTGVQARFVKARAGAPDPGVGCE